MQPVSLDSIRLDGDTQPRAEIDEGLVAEYAEAMEEEAEFPPIVVFHDGADYWLADGFHRYHAMRRIGLTGCRPDVRQGTRRDAILYSVGANAQHGKRRSDADKRKAVGTLLADGVWRDWSSDEIASRCGVSARLVRKMKQERRENPSLGTVPSESVTYTTRHGTVATMDTTNIGRKPAQEGEVKEKETPVPPRACRPQDVAQIQEAVEIIHGLTTRPYSQLPYATLKAEVSRLREFVSGLR